MFLCRDSFKIDKLRENGYYWSTDFFSGNIEGKPLMVSWKGNSSLDWNDLSRMIYDNHVELVSKSVLDDKTGGLQSEILANNFTQFNSMLEECSQIKNICL